MKITLDLESNVITLPKNFFEKVSKENKIIESHGGNPVPPMERIKASFATAMGDTDTYVQVKK